MFVVYVKLAEVPSVARRIQNKIEKNWITLKNFSLFGPAVWPALANIYK